MDETSLVEDQPLVFTQRLITGSSVEVQFTLSLTAEERTQTRRYVETDDGQGIYLRLPRGTVLLHGDVVSTASNGAENDAFIRVMAKPEPVMTVRGKTPLDLIKAAYHLGNRHVPVEVKTEFLRLSPDPVLRHMLMHMGLAVEEDVLPFEPEVGAYGHHDH